MRIKILSNGLLTFDDAKKAREAQYGVKIDFYTFSRRTRIHR
jgi:hypothetical protein